MRGDYVPTVSFRKKKIYFEHCGRGKQLIMVHSGVMSSVMFRGLSWIYTDSFELYLPDLPGSGGSGRYDEAPTESMRLRAEAICHMADLLCMDRPAIMGVGLGAVTAVNACILRPGMFSHLICDSMPGIAQNEKWEEVRRSRESSLGDEQACEFFKAIHGKDYAEVVMRDADIARSLWEEGTSGILGDVSGIDIPVLMIASRKDEVVSEAVGEAESLAKEIGDNARTKIYSDGGHPCCLSHANEVKKEVESFILGK